MVQRRRACLYMIDRLSTKISSSIKVQVGLVQLLFALHESVYGTSRSCRPRSGASAIEAFPDVSSHGWGVTVRPHEMHFRRSPVACHKDACVEKTEARLANEEAPSL